MDRKRRRSAQKQSRRMYRGCMGKEDDDTSVAQKNIFLLPTEIILNILSRLTLHQAFLCRSLCKASLEIVSSPCFNSLHYNRASPIIVIQNFSSSIRTYGDKINHHAYHMVFNLFGQQTNKTVQASTDFTLNYVSKQHPFHVPSLLGSYNGFLVFQHYYDKAVFIFNPLTQEHVLVKTDDLHRPCGLYFHPTTNEYRLLLKYHSPTRLFILSLKSKLFREISDFDFNFDTTPCTCKLPVILNGALHWMASIGDSWCCSWSGSPSCEKSILTFNMETEEFATMPHPRSPCSLKHRHRSMQLLEMDGNLCLCNFSISAGKLYSWVLEDYTRQVWVNNHVIRIQSLNPQITSYHDPFPSIQAVHIRNDELLLKATYMGLFLYDLKLKTFRKDGRKEQFYGLIVSHTNTLASLQSDNVISLPAPKQINFDL